MCVKVFVFFIVWISDLDKYNCEGFDKMKQLDNIENGIKILYYNLRCIFNDILQ